MLTATVANLREEVRAEVLRRVREFKCFNKDNDPFGEGDYGTFRIGKANSSGSKMDYFDRKSMEHGSEDPADPSMTTRVLTILHIQRPREALVAIKRVLRETDGWASDGGDYHEAY
jgi:hypothetical protein